MISSYVLVVTMTLAGWNGMSHSITTFSSQDYYTPQKYCEKVKSAVVEQAKQNQSRVSAECIELR